VDMLSKLKNRIQNKHIKIIFSDGHSDKIIEAVKILKNECLADPIVVISGAKHRDVISEYPQDIQIIDCSDETQADYWIDLFMAKDASQNINKLQRKFKMPLDAASIVLGAGGADVMVAGLTDTTEDVILSALYFIGRQDGVVSPSSLFLMNIPANKQRDNEFVVFADGGLNPSPTSEELADIAIMTAINTTNMLNWTPRVAMLSFSTKGSADHELVDKVRIATEIAQAKAPTIAIDGEFQGDAALNLDVAKRKVPGESNVAGKANILIFPDLNSGNICYKLVQHFTNADAYGPMLQGFRKNITDLSRGSTVDDIVGSAILVACTVIQNSELQ
jgi:phosphate acetyltransferase